MGLPYNTIMVGWTRVDQGLCVKERGFRGKWSWKEDFLEKCIWNKDFGGKQF